MNNDIFKTITKNHSTTFYYASLFFPKSIRHDVFVLYAFLRTADDLVDEKKDKKLFHKLKKEVYRSLVANYSSTDVIISSFIAIYHKYDFSIEYLDSFFKALESDFSRPLKIRNEKDLQKYIYGVAGVVGLMMAKIMQLPKSTLPAAKEFGQLMQLINIIRDIKEDYRENKVYLPQEDIYKYGLTNITDYKDGNRLKYEKLIRFEIARVLQRIKELSYDIELIPQPYRKAIKISRDVYRLIAEKIYQQPLLIWKKRVSVSKGELLIIILKNIF